MKKSINLWLCIVLLLFTAVFSGCQKEDKVSINNKEKVKNMGLPNEKENSIDLSIYFDASKESKNVEVAKEERTIQKDELIGELIIQEIIKGPSVKSELKPILPKETRVLSFSIKEGIAYVNLSKEAKIPMTLPKEEACLKSLALSLTQLSSIEKIKLLIENREIDVLGGNYDVSKPFGKDDINGRKK